MSEDITPNNEIDLEALVTKMQSLETMLLLTRTELKGTQTELAQTSSKLAETQTELKQSQDYIDLTLVGSVSAFAMPDVPKSWLICDGQAISRTAYPRLFQAIGTIYGEGDDLTTFSLPDLRGVFLRGWDTDGKYDPERQFGSYQSEQMQNHTHIDLGHIHDVSITEDGIHTHSANIEEDGKHSHDLPERFCMDDSEPYDDDKRKTMVDWGTHYRGDSSSTKSDGKHDHDISIYQAGTHTHLIAMNSASSQLGSPVSSDGHAIPCGDEIRVKNVSLMFCIKY